MKKLQRIIVFGNTLVLAAIAASIDHDPDCEVVACAMTASQQELVAQQPDVVIFDLDAVQPDFQYSLAEVLPGLLLIGVDPKTNRALVWSGQQVEDLSSQDLARVIHQSHFIIPISGGKNENRNSE